METESPQDEVLERLCHAVPAVGPGVCSVCRGSARPGYEVCRSCARVMGQVSRPCPRVVPISLYRIPGPLHLVLRRYKDGVAPAARARDAALVGALLEGFLRRHQRCFALADGRSWDLITTVPATRHRPWLACPGGPAQPLAEAVALRPWLRDLHVTTLVRSASPLAHNLAADGAFTAAGALAGALAGATVLVIDDTYTTGARAQSAACALARAGARVLAVVPIGRVVDPAADLHAARHWQQSTSRPFDLGRCALDCTAVSEPSRPDRAGHG